MNRTKKPGLKRKTEYSCHSALNQTSYLKRWLYNSQVGIQKCVTVVTEGLQISQNSIGLNNKMKNLDS